MVLTVLKGRGPDGPRAVLEQAEQLVADGARGARSRTTDLPAAAQSASAPPTTTREEERALAARCLAGDRRAMAEVYERYKRRVFGICLRIAGGNDAEELAQEVFIRIFRGLASFRGDAQLGTWIYRLTVNAALSHCSRRPREQLDPGDGDATSRASDSRPSRDVPLAVALERALAELSAGYRAVIVLHDIEGLSHEEIADVLGCEIGTSKSQLHKARARMRALLAAPLARREPWA